MPKDDRAQIGEDNQPGILGRVRSAVGTVKQTAKSSAEMMTGADIRRFEEFVDATTTVVVGMHRDQRELDKRLAQLERQTAVRQSTTLIIGLGVVSVLALILSIVALIS